MRIALLSHQWPGIRMGGIGSYVQQCAAALASAGHEAHVFTFEIPADLRAATPGGVSLHETPDLSAHIQAGTIPPQFGAVLNVGGQGVYRLALAWLLRTAMLQEHRKQPFDVVETPEVEALGLPMLLGNDCDVPVITHLHCCTAIAQKANNGSGPVNDPSAVALEFASIHMADALCAPTQAVVEVTRTFVPIAHDVHVIPHPFVCGDEAFTEPPIRGPIIFVGRIERLKGVETIAEALNLFLPRNPGANFIFIGPDTSSADACSMLQFIKSRILPDLAPRVQFTGELSPTQVREHLRACSFTVMPSLWENFSLACCESMAAGRAVIISSGTGSVELIGDAGIIAERGSPKSLACEMEKLWRNRNDLLSLSRRAYTHARSAFDPSRIAGQKIDFYGRTIARFDRAARAQRLSSLPPAIATSLLPALSAITGALSGCAPAADTPGTRLLAIMQRLRTQRGDPARVLLYGAGKYTARLLTERHLWESSGHRIVGIIDDHPRFADSPTCMGLPVQSVESARRVLASGTPLPPIVLSTDTYTDQFWQQTAALRSAGVTVLRL